MGLTPRSGFMHRFLIKKGLTLPYLPLPHFFGDIAIRMFTMQVKCLASETWFCYHFLSFQDIFKIPKGGWSLPKMELLGHLTSLIDDKSCHFGHIMTKKLTTLHAKNRLSSSKTVENGYLSLCVTTFMGHQIPLLGPFKTKTETQRTGIFMLAKNNPACKKWAL